MPYLEECSTAGCVVCEPDLCRTCGGGTVDQGSNCDCKHRHGQWVPLGGSLARVDHPSANEKRSMAPVRIDDVPVLCQCRAEDGYVPKSELPVHAVERITGVHQYHRFSVGFREDSGQGVRGSFAACGLTRAHLQGAGRQPRFHGVVHLHWSFR